MELGLRLGNDPPFGFPQKPPSDPSVSHRGLEFCLAFSSILEQDEASHRLKRKQLDTNDVVGRVSNPPPPVLHLGLLPPTVAVSRRSSETGVFTDVISGATAEGGGESEFLERDWWRGGSDNEEEEDQDLGCRKKLRLSRQKSAFLEESFKQHHTLYPKQKLELARRLNLRPRQVEVWFQNRRARTKLKQTEVDCEYLKKYCETLTQQNRKLQKEVQDLRALKTTESLFMHLPATTLALCPSCELAAATAITR